MSSAELWNGGQYELVAARFAEVHDALVEALAPQAGERWLDVAAAAFRAAMFEHWSQFETPEGVREPRRYLLVLGERR